ncbi:GNAT family N-acetyltransferase [Streptosporangium sp. NPDC051022]|uniref:GNAT family N-acetyltransferase n=1 Tax=Streptosporangium sp. NPDC051022 TaxID=3155752 RepID=UPI003430BFF2
MAAPPGWTQLRYRWASGTGTWAQARQWLASAPGRRFENRRFGTAEHLLSIVYQGFPEGLIYVMPYLRDQQVALAGTVNQADPVDGVDVADVADTVDGAPVSWRGVRRSAHAPEADILVVGCSRRRALGLPRERSVLLPFRVHMLLDVVGDAETMHRSVSANERRQFARLRREHGWTCEIGTRVDDLRFFYDRMHLPTMATRHGEETRSTDWDIALRALFRRGMVLFVREGGRRVAGVLCRLEDDGRTLRMRLLGVLDGDEAHYRSGAVKAVYYLTMEWAAGNGVTRIDFSGGDPFPGKGVFQFKRRFHPTIAHPADHFGDRRVYVQVARDTAAVRDFLVATPMFTVDDSDRLVATHFFDGVRPPRRSVRADGPGVHASRDVDLDVFLAGLAPPAVPAGGIGRTAAADPVVADPAVSGVPGGESPARQVIGR